MTSAMGVVDFSRLGHGQVARVVRGLLCALATGVLLALVPSDASAVARSDLAVRVAAVWPAQQTSEGRFNDYLNAWEPMGRTRYAESMLGYGLVQTGIDEGRQDLVESGLQALAYTVSHAYATVPGGPSVFENMAVASAYNLARKNLSGNRAFEAIRPQWEDWLRRVALV
ncbi:MAG TPA: hypothetical protein VEW95_06130, partial [Candidatus Limnocylindrales bacterium]|nr:hypothetical protein [Candidatus Limnocylindrales bacterium]